MKLGRLPIKCCQMKCFLRWSMCLC
jgi:hypothetical protein